MAEKFKVFLSWSGERSKLAARALREWLPFVLQSVEPWMSEQDIQAGQQWFDEIGKKLKYSGYGIFCLTNENLNKPWILFEAGAIWKAFEGTLLSAYTFGLSPADIPGIHPLSQFQGTKADKDGTRKLIEGINNAMGSEKIDPSMLNKLFDKWWIDLETSLNGIPDIKQETEVPQQRSDRDLLEDVLNTVRLLEQKLLVRSIETVYSFRGAASSFEDEIRIDEAAQLPLPIFSPKETLITIFQLNPKIGFSFSRIKELLAEVGAKMPDLGDQLMNLTNQGMINMLVTKNGAAWRLNSRMLGGAASENNFGLE